VGVMIVAAIVAGEVGTSVPDARMLVACQVVRDAEAGRSIGPPRWNGYSTPGIADIEAAQKALYTDACDAIPPFRFLGNANDLRIWRSRGYVDGDDAILFIRRGPFTVVGVLEQSWAEYFESRGGPVPR